MAYRNKTYVAFASEDIHWYRLMTAWKVNQHIDFDFYDAHEINFARDTSQVRTIEAKLTERLQNTKQVVILIGEHTRAKAGDGFSFLHHEVTVIHRLGLPVVFANLSGSLTANTAKIPLKLLDMYSISVPIRPQAIKYALDNYPSEYYQNLRNPVHSLRKYGPYQYTESVYMSQK